MAALELLGPDGRPIRKEELTSEVAGPTMTGIRSIVGGHPAQGLTPTRLASILRAAEAGDAMAYLELCEEMEEKEPRYTAVLGMRKRQVSQLEITVEPASESAHDEVSAELVRSFLQREELEDEIFDILDSVGKGYSVTEIVWETSERDWMPSRLRWRMPQWFELDRVDGETLHLRRDPASGSTRERNPAATAPPSGLAWGLEPLAPYKFIVHHTQAKSGLPIRGGLARIVAWWYLFKNYTIKDWVTFCEVYGQPLRVGKFHAAASEDDKRVLLRALSSIGTDAAAMIPEGMLIEFVRGEGGRESSQIYSDLVSYIDQLVTILVLGQNLTTQVEGGSRAAAQIHNEVRGDIERADSRQLAATLNRDLVRPIIDLNRGPQQAYPRIRIGRPEQADVAVLSEAIARLVPLGLKVGQAEIRRKIGVEDPADDDELLEAPAAPPNPFGPGRIPSPLEGDGKGVGDDGAPPDEVEESADRDAEAGEDATDQDEPGGSGRPGRMAAGAATYPPSLRAQPGNPDALPRAAGARRPSAASADQLQIDDEAERLAGDWERALGRRVRDIMDLAESSSDLETFRSRLVELAALEPDVELTAALERIGLNGRLWGYWRARRSER